MPPLTDQATNTTIDQLAATDTAPPNATTDYSPDELASLQAIEMEASNLFPIGKTFASISLLRKTLQEFAHKKGFAVASAGSSILCSRSAERKGVQNKRDRKQPVPLEKQRKISSTRCGCTFSLKHSPVDQKDKSNKAIKISQYSRYMHTNGCLPSTGQLMVEKRKAGQFTASVNESQIKTILSVMHTGKRVPIDMMRDLMRPLFPPGTSLDAQLVFNFRLKSKRMLADGMGDLRSFTITEEQEQYFLSNGDLDFTETPVFMTEVFAQFRELLKEALTDQNDLHQITSYLNSLAKSDPSFDYRIG